MLSAFSDHTLAFLSLLFIFVVGLGALAVIVMFFVDIMQTRDAIRHNFPVVGRFRTLFSKLGEFFRQYFFAMDREEMPFNRAEREWVYRSALGIDNTVPFGSSKNLNPPGTILFVNSLFPVQKQDATHPPAVTIGPYCPQPYSSQSLINISGMSFGAISTPAVEALSRGAKRANCWLNTGEGGLTSMHLSGNCDLVFQIGTAKYGVRDSQGRLSASKLQEIAALPQVKMFELKISQGAKPGKGGILPASKVTAEIARIRGIPMGHDSISPNRHPEVGNFVELLDFIEYIRANVKKPVGFKVVIGSHQWLEEMCLLIHDRGIRFAPDFITIDGGDGGTGAAPMPLIDNVGLPIKAALPRVVDVLTKYGLRDRIRILASGKLITPAEVAWAYSAGADFVTSARGFMFALGCIQALRCNKNTCPTGITTHDPRLQEALDPVERAQRIHRFVRKIHYGAGLIANSCGVAHARALTRAHCQIVQENTVPVPFSELYPLPDVLKQYRH